MLKIETPQLPSERKFGLFFAFVFTAICLYTGYKYGIGIVCIIAAILAAAFLFFALLKPDALRPLNKSWTYIGLLLGLIISPIVLGLIYFMIFTPVAAVLRLKGRDELRLKNNGSSSHWIVRDPRGPAPESFQDQY